MVDRGIQRGSTIDESLQQCKPLLHRESIRQSPRYPIGKARAYQLCRLACGVQWLGL
jgi:hypothetical protein